jgi:hypothetical protein
MQPSNSDQQHFLRRDAGQLLHAVDVQSLSAIRTAANHQFFIGLRELGNHFRSRHGVNGKAVRSADRSSGRIRHQTRYRQQHGGPRCFSDTLRVTPLLRAVVRRRVISATVMPRYSAIHQRLSFRCQAGHVADDRFLSHYDSELKVFSFRLRFAAYIGITLHVAATNCPGSH